MNANRFQIETAGLGVIMCTGGGVCKKVIKFTLISLHRSLRTEPAERRKKRSSEHNETDDWALKVPSHRFLSRPLNTSLLSTEM